jgi:hypothetical protein
VAHEGHLQGPAGDPGGLSHLRQRDRLLGVGVDEGDRPPQRRRRDLPGAA